MHGLWLGTARQLICTVPCRCCHCCWSRYHNHDAHAEFWTQLCRSGLTLISSTDVASSSVSPQEARAFIAQQEDTSAAAAPAAEVVDLADDDLEDME